MRRASAHDTHTHKEYAIHKHEVFCHALRLLFIFLWPWIWLNHFFPALCALGAFVRAILLCGAVFSVCMSRTSILLHTHAREQKLTIDRRWAKMREQPVAKMAYKAEKRNTITAVNRLKKHDS